MNWFHVPESVSNPHSYMLCLMGLGFLGSASFCWLLLVAALLLHARDTRQGQKARSVSAG